MITVRTFLFLIIAVSILLCFLLLQDTLNWNYNIHTNHFQSDEAKLLEEIGILKQQLLEINSRTLSPTDKKTKKDLGIELANLTKIIEQYAQAVKTPGFGLIQNVQSFLSNPISPEIRRKDRADLGKLVQERIQTLQNPVDCANARKLLCTVNHPCGFGCVVHFVIYCLITAYSTDRTLILNLTVKYEGPSWNDVFLPLSNTCLDDSGSSHGTWGGSGSNISAQVLSVGIFGTMSLIPPWDAMYPSEVPLDIASRLEKVSSNPVMWWVGQFATYIMRLSKETGKMIMEAKTMLNKSMQESSTSNASFIQVGVQVRRTDKLILEAKPHKLEEYMWHVDEYIQVREKVDGNNYIGQVFLASDEPKVIHKARQLEGSSNSSKWKVWANESIAEESKKVNQRFRNGMLPILIDLMLLAECEFVVCTFSSNICRLVAELKEVDPAAKGKVVSLDDGYYFLPFTRKNSQA